MIYAGKDNTFVPEKGQPIDPLDMPAEQADMIFGKPIMDELRKIDVKMTDKLRGRTVQFVQVSP